MTVNELIENNLGLARKVANYYYDKNKRYDYEEFLSLAQLGIVKAAKAFNPDKGLKFSTFAYRVASNEILLRIKTDKNFNYKNGVPMNVELLPASLNIVINEEGRSVRCEIIDTISDNYGDKYSEVDLLDLIEKISLKNKYEEKAIEKAHRNVKILKDYLIHGHSLIDISKKHKITSTRVGQIVGEFTKKAKKYI